MTYGSSTTKTNGRDAGVGATAQRGKLENDDLSVHRNVDLKFK